MSSLEEPVSKSDDSSNFFQLDAKIAVVAVGGAGANILDTLIDRGCGQYVTTVAINTDKQALARSKAQRRLVLGADITLGRGTGADPNKGRELALLARDAVGEHLSGFDMVFVVAGLGGGTGSGAAPVIAEALRETGALVVSVGTWPFSFEGRRRGRTARTAHEQFITVSDSVFILRNDQLMYVADESTKLKDAMKLVDNHVADVLDGVVGVLGRAGAVNVDFADVRAILSGQGEAFFAVGRGAGNHRVQDALMEILDARLARDHSLDRAKGVLLYLECKTEPTLQELSDLVEQVQSEAHPDVNLIWGWNVREDLASEVRLTLMATGFASTAQAGFTLGERLTRTNGNNGGYRGVSSETAPPVFTPME